MAIFGFFMLIPLAALVLTLWALIDAVKSEFEGNMKLVWILIILFVGIIGPILYLAIGREQKIG